MRPAKATSCRAAIRTAKGLVSDFGESAKHCSPGLSELAACREDHSERGVHSIIEKYNLSVPIPLTVLPKAPGVIYPGEMRGLSLCDWAQWLVDLNLWHIHVGLAEADSRREQKILSKFWKRFRAIKPTHEVFKLADSGRLDLTRCCPMMVHGDEGRGRKKSGFLVVSVNSYLGLGTQEANLARERGELPREYARMMLNYVGSPFCHRILLAVLPKMFGDHEAFLSIMDFVAAECKKMLLQGVRDRSGRTFTMCILHNTGDWQWHVKAGNLVRSYANVQKRPLTADSNPKGICHLCRAGQRGIDWEGYRADSEPRWYRSMYEEDPFGNPRPALNTIPHVPQEQPGFYTYDLFHTFHLGIGKSFVAGCLALASEQMEASQADARFAELTELYFAFCAEHHVVSYLSGISRSTIGWPDSSSFPNGQWSKGHLTRSLSDFFMWWAEQHDLSHHRLLAKCKETNLLISHCMKRLYSRDVWLSRNDATFVSTTALQFLEGYSCLATMAYNEDKNLFPHMPKGHSMHHIFYDLKVLLMSSPHAEWFLSPLCHSVQIHEDWVGRCSRLARRVAAGQVVLRVLQRNLQACYKHFREQGYLKE